MFCVALSACDFFLTYIYQYADSVVQDYLGLDAILGQRHAERDIWTKHIVYTEISPYKMLKTPIRNQIDYTVRNINPIDVTSVKRCKT